jgi:diguanylate cyclase (GGDEF)-like protein
LNLARTAIVSVAILIAALTAATTGLIGRRLRSSLRLARDEAQRLVLVTEGKDRRNAQFQALYQVVTEVTENLNLRYVVETAVTQARPLIRAEEVRLRLLRGDSLIVVGATIERDPATAATEMPLGTGAVGRAARRGRSLRTGDVASLAFPVPEAPEGARSGLVVPLIVGARVVGTIECWSAVPDAFDVDDERVLELMASQVATAVSAADTNEASERDAHHDPLTGLPNRRQFARDVRERFATELRAGEQYAFAMIDIDHFKRFNDDYGHRVGDITLQRVAEVMRSAIREGDAIYRYGGEEFTIAVPFAEPEDVELLLDRVRLAVSRTSLTGENLQPLVPVTVSIGVAFGPALGTDPEALTMLADRALYHSKAAGRNRITVYGPALEEVASPTEPLALPAGAGRGTTVPGPAVSPASRSA